VLDRGANVSSSILGELRVDFLWARRAYGQQILARAIPVALSNTVVSKVPIIEDLVALKLQALVNDPTRGRDRTDIAELLRIHATDLNMDAVRHYATTIGAERELDEILGAQRR